MLTLQPLIQYPHMSYNGNCTVPPKTHKEGAIQQASKTFPVTLGNRRNTIGHGTHVECK